MIDSVNCSVQHQHCPSTEIPDSKYLQKPVLHGHSIDDKTVTSPFGWFKTTSASFSGILFKLVILVLIVRSCTVILKQILSSEAALEIVT